MNIEGTLERERDTDSNTLEILCRAIEMLYRRSMYIANPQYPVFLFKI
jgi:hypothetical protein